MSFWVSSAGAARALVVLAGVAAAVPAVADACNQGGGSVVDRLLRMNDASAPVDECPTDRCARRGLLLEMLAASPRCYVANPTDEQLREIMERYRAFPVGEVLAGGLVNRFFQGGSAWVGDGLIGSNSQAARATLKYSFPNDGVWWRDSANGLNAAFTGQFGATNLDRGREYARQALAAWRRMAGLSYIEVIDTNVAFTNSTGPVGGGDIRIGASVQGSGGVLAYNFYPDGGGDMSLNITQMTPTSLFNSTNNYRYLRNVVAHEHGHGLGFAHPVPCNQTKLMEPFASSAFETTQIDEMRGAQRNYGDRFAGNISAATAKDFGSLTSPAVQSVIERNLSTNGAAGVNSTNQDWYKFTLGSTQNVVITVAPTGGSYLNAQQDSAGGCNPTTQPTVNAQQAGNLNVELRNAAGTTILQQAAGAAAGSNEVLTANNLAAGIYTVRVVDAGPNLTANQVLQLYDLTIRVGMSRAPPLAIAGVNKRLSAGQPCYFMGDLNSRINDTGATLNNASYDWDLDGDSIFETNDQPQPTRTYTSNGVVNVTLRVTDSNGMSATDTITVAVGGAVPTLTSVTPPTGQIGATIPVTLVGMSLSGVASASQVTLSGFVTGSGVTATGTPTVSPDGTTVSGLSFVISISANAGPRDITITNADGAGQAVVVQQLFTVTSTPPTNDTCDTPISWGSVSGARPFTNTAATTGAPQSFPGTSCPAAGPINNDVWYSWTAPSNGNLNVSCDSGTAGSPNLFFSRVAAYYGVTCPPGAVLGCDDFGSGFNMFAMDGRTYLFQVGSTNTGFWGTANVNLVFTPILGACCDTSANCSLLPSNACIGGSMWQGSGTTCELFPCPMPEGACCAPAGGCIVTEASGCEMGSTFTAGGACTPNPCAQPTGSCCAASGGCVETEQSACDGGRVWTSGAVCAPNPCSQPSGACCAADGSCVSQTQAACAGGGGVWQGAGTGCAPNQCPQPTGACCAADGSCASAMQAACAGGGGAWQGAGTVCSPNPCPQPTGACCTLGSCATVTEAVCEGGGGAWRGIGTMCTPNPCPQPIGACCNTTACSVGTQSACVSGGGAYRGNASACGPSGNPTTCCPANFNQQTGITVQDIFDFLSAYFGNLPSADFNGMGGLSVQDIFDFLAAYFSGCPG